MDFEFRCQSCGEIHRGMPSFGADAPLSFFAVPEAERASRCDLGSDDCVIELEPTDHPLALEQRNGISVERVADIYAIMMHGRDH